MADREQRIRELAYGIWEQEGRPEGRAETHWLTAERAIEAMDRAEVEITMNAGGAQTTEEPLAEKQIDPARNGDEPPEPGPVNE